LVALLLAGASSIAAAKYQFRFGPRVGGPQTVFVATFVSPITLTEDSEFYIAPVRGPGRCQEVTQDSESIINKGTRVTFRFDVNDVLITNRDAKPVYVRGWCVGRYAGLLTYC
jgi:hypothetical protein